MYSGRDLNVFAGLEADMNLNPCGRRVLTLATAFATAMAMTPSLVVNVTAAQAATQGAITVTDADGNELYTAPVETGSTINIALRKALEVGKSAESCQQTIVNVPAGTYYLDNSAGPRIYSNTKLRLDAKTKLVASKERMLMVEGSHFSSGTTICKSTSACAHGGHTQFSNIEICGGTWSANCKAHPTWNGGIFLLQHGCGISIHDTTFESFTNHAVNVAGSKDVAISSTTFKDAVAYTGTSTRFWGKTTPGNVDRIRSTEAIHTDFTSRTGESTAYPLDNTPCENVAVTGCIFSNTYSGVGTHHESASLMQNITVTGCSFSLKDGNAVNLFSCKGAEVKGNTLTGGYSLVRADKSIATVSGNTASKCTGNAITGTNGSNLVVSKNKVSAPKAAGILFSKGSKGSVSGNVVTSGSKATGINISSSKATVSSNKVSGGTIGIALKTPTGSCSVSGNTVKSVAGNGIYVYSAKKGSITVKSNKVTSCSAAGLRVDKSSSVTASKNTLSGKKYGVSISASQKVKVDSNRLYGSVNVVRVDKTSTSITISKNTMKRDGKLCSSNAVYFYGKCTGTITGNSIYRAGTSAVRIDGKCSVKVSLNTIYKPSQYGISYSSSKVSLSKNKITSPGKGKYHKS